MFTRIGRPAAAGDAVALLLDCHERIRSFLALAREIAEVGPSDPASIPEAAGRVRRYFTEALPLHALDEEASILPRLRGLDGRVDAELEAMAREHREHEPSVRELVAACEAIATPAGPSPSDSGPAAPGHEQAAAPGLAERAARVGRAAAGLERHFVEHLGREEAVIFPAMRRLLDASADAVIVREIRERRAVRVPAASS